MLTSSNVANNFLEYGFNENIHITPMKLQKLVYILYKEYLKETDYKLFSETFEAWKYGPVLPNLYSEFKNFKAKPITKYALNSDSSVSKVKMEPGTQFYIIFNSVWTKYKHFSGGELSDFTHKTDGAWDKSIKNNTYILADSDIKEEENYV